MKRPPSIIGALAESQWVGRPLYRRLLVLLLVAICGVLTVYPERYRAAVTLTPTDPANLGLSGALGQLGAINTVFGNQAAIEIAIKVARGQDVRQIVAKRLKFYETQKFGNKVETDRWLTDKVSIRSLRGGIIQMEVFDRDPVFAKQIVAAFSEATRERLAEINRQQTAYKRDVLIKLVDESSERLALAQEAYDSFRLRTRNSEPNLALTSSTERIESIRSAIKSREVRLKTARQFATDDNISVKQILAEIGALNQQLQFALAQNPKTSGSVGIIVQQSTQVKDLERKLAIAQRLYDSYARFLEGTSVEDLTSTANIRVLEPPYIDAERQINYIALACAILFILIALSIEFYQLRPPVGGLSKESRE